MAELTKEQKFELMVMSAEQYIMDKASDILFAIRNRDPENSKPKCCSDLLSDYKPKFNDAQISNAKEKIKKNEEVDIFFDKIIEHFCHELQNYQAMPRAINYASYDSKNEDGTISGDNNTILTSVKKFFQDNYEDLPSEKPKTKINTWYLKLYKAFKDVQDNEGNKKLNIREHKEFVFVTKEDSLYEKDKEEPIKDEKGEIIKENYIKEYFDPPKDKLYKINDKLSGYKSLYNYAWYKYSRGIVDVLIAIKKRGQENGCKNFDDNKKKFVEYIIKECEYFDELKKNYTKQKIAKVKKEIKNFSKEITGLGETMTYDFFKELHCEYLIKDDTHIIECYKHFINQNEKKENIFVNFLDLCIQYWINHTKYTPYYIDKILWLCCTGAFYKHDITIHSMTRNDFLKN